jgi:cobalt-zinc-cadmium efflux system outer membrane protein
MRFRKTIPLVGMVTILAVARVAAQNLAGITLEQVLRASQERHPAVDAANGRITMARGARRGAGAWGNPVLAWNLENARWPGGDPVQMPREDMLTASFPLESIYQRGPRAARADAAVRAAGADALMDRRGIALGGARTYYALALAQVRVEIARDLALWVDSLVDWTRIRAREGVAAEADLLRSILEREQVESHLTTRRVEQAQAAADVATFLPEVPADAMRVAVPTRPFPVPATEVTVDSSVALRPEIAAGRHRVAEATEGIRAGKRGLFQTLDATVGAKWAMGGTSLLLGASVPLPIFNQNRGEVDRARGEQAVRTAELNLATRGVRAEIAAAESAARLLTARSHQLAGASVADSSSLLARADEMRRIALGAYQEGAATLVQVLDAARAWGQAREMYYETLFAQHQSILALLVARGYDPLPFMPQLEAGQEPPR